MINLDEILEVDHIDVFMVPSGDLAQSMGLPGQGNHPEVQAVVDETMRRITKKGKITGAIANKDNVKNIYELESFLVYMKKKANLESNFKKLKINSNLNFDKILTSRKIT